METALKREERENPYAGLPPPDTIREQTNRDSELSDLLIKYEEFLSKEINYNNIDWIVQSNTIILNPKEIDDFLQQTILYEKHKNYQTKTGIFISQLIQTSYNAGNNNFELNTKKLKTINRIGAYLIGKEKNPIFIKIEGNTGHRCGSTSSYSTFTIQGNTKNGCGYNSQHNIFNIKGDTGWHYGSSSQNSIFNIEGDTRDDCGYETENCNFNIQGNTGDDCGHKTQNSTFNIQGNTEDYCGYETQNSIFNIQGNTGKECGSKTQNCNFNIKKSVKDRCGYESKDSTFNIQGEIGKRCYIKAQNNTIITHNIESYQMVIRESSENNTIFLTNNSGHILDFVKK